MLRGKSIGLAWLTVVFAGACSATDVTRPHQGVIDGVDSTEANKLVLTLASATPSSGFTELDTVTVAATVLTLTGSVVDSGDVVFSAGENVVQKRGRRNIQLRLKTDQNVIKATYQTARGVILQASLIINAKPAALDQIAVVWQADGSITEIPRPANIKALYPRAINENGQVVGTAQTESGNRAFTWSAGDGLRIISSTLEDYSEGLDINDDGIVAGYRRVVTSINGFLWAPVSGFVPVSTEGATTVAVGINNAGIVAGIRNFSAVVWSPDSGFRQLQTPTGTQCSGTTAIATSGHVIGWVGSELNDGYCFHWSPVLWDPNGSVHIISDCGAQVDCPVQVTDVSSGGEVIGNRNGRPFRWSAARGFREMLGDASGTAVRSNDSGDVAGELNYPTAFPVVWYADNHMRVLPLPPGRSAGTAYGVNTKGQAVGLVKR